MTVALSDGTSREIRDFGGGSDGVQISGDIKVGDTVHCVAGAPGVQHWSRARTKADEKLARVPTSRRASTSAISQTNLAILSKLGRPLPTGIIDITEEKPTEFVQSRPVKSTTASSDASVASVSDAQVEVAEGEGPDMEVTAMDAPKAAKRKRTATLDEDVLLSARGLPTLIRSTMDQSWRRGDEVDQSFLYITLTVLLLQLICVSSLLARIKQWAFQLTPGLSFETFLRRCETIGTKTRMRVWPVTIRPSFSSHVLQEVMEQYREGNDPLFVWSERPIESSSDNESDSQPIRFTESDDDEFELQGPLRPQQQRQRSPSPDFFDSRVSVSAVRQPDASPAQPDQNDALSAPQFDDDLDDDLIALALQAAAQS